MTRMRFGKTYGASRKGWRNRFLQGLIQAAVAFHHHSTGNVVGAGSLMERARKNLAGCPEEFGGFGWTDCWSRWSDGERHCRWVDAVPDIRGLCRSSEMVELRPDQPAAASPDEDPVVSFSLIEIPGRRIWRVVAGVGEGLGVAAGNPSGFSGRDSGRAS